MMPLGYVRREIDEAYQFEVVEEFKKKYLNNKQPTKMYDLRDQSFRLGYDHE